MKKRTVLCDIDLGIWKKGERYELVGIEEGHYFIKNNGTTYKCKLEYFLY